MVTFRLKHIALISWFQSLLTLGVVMALKPIKNSLKKQNKTVCTELNNYGKTASSAYWMSTQY